MEQAKQHKRKFNKLKISPYIFIFPFFFLFAIFMLYPIIYSLILSFNSWTAGEMTFVGLDNYKQLFSDTLFWKSLKNTGIYLIVQVPFMIILSTVVAVIINSNKVKFNYLFRIAFFLPALIDLVTYSIIFSLLFNEGNGLINQVLGFIGIDAISWKTDGFWAKIMIISVITWRWMGYNCVIILSGLQYIPEDIYESADLDGAGPTKKFLHITIPMLKPILLFCMILSTIGTLQLFAEPLILTGGGPSNETTSVMLYLYEKAFGSFNFGLASAGAYIVTTIIAVISFIQIKVTGGGEV